MTERPQTPTKIKRRYGAVIIGTVFAFALLLLVANRMQDFTIDDGLTPVSELAAGSCFEYPGDGVEPTRVETIDCSMVHYGEVVGTTTAGDNDSCVGVFEAYTGLDNYWESGMILGFLPFDDSMHCYLYGPEDFAGSLRG